MAAWVSLIGATGTSGGVSSVVLAGLALRLVQTAVTTRGDAATSDSLSGVVLAGLAPELVQIFANVAQSTTDMKRVAVALAAASDLGITVARARSVNLIGSNRLAVGTTRSVVLASLAPELARAAADTRTVATPLPAMECPALFLPACT